MHAALILRFLSKHAGVNPPSPHPDSTDDRGVAQDDLKPLAGILLSLDARCMTLPAAWDLSFHSVRSLGGLRMYLCDMDLSPRLCISAFHLRFHLETTIRNTARMLTTAHSSMTLWVARGCNGAVLSPSRSPRAKDGLIRSFKCTRTSLLDQYEGRESRFRRLMGASAATTGIRFSPELQPGHRTDSYVLSTIPCDLHIHTNPGGPESHRS